MRTIGLKYQVLPVLLVFGLSAALAGATDTKKFREGGGVGYTDVTFDDTYIVCNPADDTTHGDQTYDGIQCSSSLASLIAIKDLFTQLPPTSGGSPIVITLAKLHLFRYQGSSSTTLSINRLTTNWLPGSAGTNENDVSGMHADKSANTHWASGGNFSSSDYDSTPTATGPWGDAYDQELIYTVTDQIAEIYSTQVNYGLVVRAGGKKTAIGRASEHTTLACRPSLEITYSYPGASYTLTVNSGTGDGSYTQGTVVNISADAPPSGKVFDKWTGDTSGIANVNAANTTLTMPATNQTVTATYTNAVYYALTVNSGTGDGSYTQGTVVNISADAPPSGKTFDKWIGNTSGIADVNASSTTLTMPAANQTITATYVDAGSGPSISGTSGTWAEGNTITISGSSFGSKSTAKPLAWAPFDSDISPTSLGQLTSWASIENMEWSSEYGGCAKANNDIGPWTLEADYNYWTTDGQKIYIYKKEKQNFLITDTSQNWKIWRMWCPGLEYPNIYASASNGRVYTEGLEPDESGFWDSDDLFRIQTTNWVTVELIVQASTYGNKDGLLKINYDCSEVASGTIMTRNKHGQDYMTMNFVVHGVLANIEQWNPPWSTSNRMWADDVYVDTTWSRVMVGDASTWSGCTHKEMQIPSAWSGSSITITAHKGDFSSFSGKYLYVVDSSGNVNANGYACQ